MGNVLFVNACVRPDSRTRILAQEVLDCLDRPYTEVELNREQFPAMDREALELRENLREMELRTHPRFAPAWQFARAETIVVAAPFWDLSFPGLLKNYIEYINVSDITFTYVKDQPVGLCHAKRLYYVTTAGGPIFADFGFSYMEALAKSFYGIPEVVGFAAQGLDLEGSDVNAILSDAKEKIRKALCPGKI